jgi:hypothetical protein
MHAAQIASKSLGHNTVTDERSSPLSRSEALYPNLYHQNREDSSPEQLRIDRDTYTWCSRTFNDSIHDRRSFWAYDRTNRHTIQNKSNLSNSDTI